MNKLTKFTECPECGSNSFSWAAQIIIANEAQQNRLSTHDVKSVFVLGCDHCSATLAVMSADEVAARINALGQKERVAASPEVAPIKDQMKWLDLEFEWPSPAEHDRVLIYTQGSDFAGVQVFDVKTETLLGYDYEDPSDRPEECLHATHWMPRPDF